jgi:hypothetical protein
MERVKSSIAATWFEDLFSELAQSASKVKTEGMWHFKPHQLCES